MDPLIPQVGASKTKGQQEPWNGEFYCSFGHDMGRSWEDAVEFGFISAGGGAWYSRTLQLLGPEDRIWVNIPNTGYVGVGRVTGHMQPASEFTVEVNGEEKPILDVAKRDHYHREHINDEERCEYFVPVHWLQTVPVDRAIKEVGFFGNRQTICQPTTPKWRTTVERLKQVFTKYDEA